MARPPARFAVSLVAAFCLGAPSLGAQSPAPPPARSLLHYAANESGGRIRVTAIDDDSAAVEAVRRELLEAAAAFRRGDLRKLRLLPADSPAVPILAARREQIRCTFRAVPKGGELVLLSDDGPVVQAIHSLLAQAPPGA